MKISIFFTSSLFSFFIYSPFTGVF